MSTLSFNIVCGTVVVALDLLGVFSLFVGSWGFAYAVLAGFVAAPFALMALGLLVDEE